MLNKKENKRGGLNLMSSQIIKVILAISGILLVLFLLVLFYNMFFAKQDEQQAKGTLDRIYQTIIETQSGETKSFEAYTPQGWTIVAFDSVVKKYDRFNKPASFTYKYALCICKKDCKAEICRELKKPFMKDDKFFLVPIISFKKYYLSDEGDIYNVVERIVDITKQPIVNSELVGKYQKDDSWKSLGEFRVTRYYTPYENDFQSWKNPISRTDGDGLYYCQLGDERQFYETVKCEGSGLGANGEIYKYDTIRETKEKSVPYDRCSSCELGMTSLGTDPTPGRTIAVDKSIIPSSPNSASVVYLEFDCEKVVEQGTCNKEECEKWNKKYYLAEDAGSAIKGQHIDLFVGAGQSRLSGTNCLPEKANIWLGPLISVAEIKEEDEKNKQATATQIV